MREDYESAGADSASVSGAGYIAPPLALLRLREAGVVRLCGLAAASRGLDLAARHALSQVRREGARLSALVGVDTPIVAWFEVISADPTLEALTLAATRWGCAAHAPDAAGATGTPGCEHVAAILSAWVRAPGDFRTPTISTISTAPTPTTPPVLPTPIAPVAPTAPESPPTSSASTRTHQPLGVLDELRRLPERDLHGLARRLLTGSAAVAADTSRAEMQAALAGALRDPAALARILAGLDGEARETLAWLRLAGGALTSADLEAFAARAGRSVSAFRYALATLERHGLLFRTAPLERGAAGWRIAPETRAALPRELPIQPLSRTEIAAERPRVERASPRALLLALALLPHAPAPLGAPDPLPHPERAISLTPLDLSEPALLAAARSAGLDPDATRLARRLTSWSLEDDDRPGERRAIVFPCAAESQPAEHLRAYQTAFARWRNARSPADLVDLERATKTIRLRYDHTHEAFRPAALADEAALARRWVTRLLGLAEPNVWYRVDDLIELIWRVNPYFLRGKQLTWRTPVWRLERVTDGRPLRPTVREEWQAAEGAYLRALLAEPLRLWGALDLALDSDKTPRLFRLTPLGAALLARPETAAPQSESAARALAFDWGPAAALTREGALAVQPLAAPTALLAALEQWAEVTAVAGARLLYTFTPARALARFDEGLSVEQALAPLRAAGLARAAQILGAKLEGWRQGYGDARLTSGLVIVEGRDEAVLREALAAAPGLAPRARHLGPAVVALTPPDAEALRAALTRKGWEL